MHQQFQEGKHPQEVSEGLVSQAWDEGSTDNITVVVVSINKK